MTWDIFLVRSSRANSGRGDPLGFLLYSLQGFVDGLREQSRFIAGMQLELAWEHFVYGEFQRIPSSPAMRRRREVTLALGRAQGPVAQARDTGPEPRSGQAIRGKDRQDADPGHELAGQPGLPGERGRRLPGES